MTDDSSKSVRWLPTSSGRLSGWMGLVFALVLAILAVRSMPLPWLGIAAMVAWLSWAAMLRLRIGLTADTLVLRGLVSTTTIPLGRIRELTIQQVLAVWVGEKRYVSAAVGRGRPRRRRLRMTASTTASTTPQGQMHEADAIEQAIRAAMRDTIGNATPVTRTWAWPVIGLGAASVVLFVVLLLI